MDERTENLVESLLENGPVTLEEASRTNAIKLVVLQGMLEEQGLLDNEEFDRNMARITANVDQAMAEVRVRLQEEECANLPSRAKEFWKKINEGG